MRPRIQPAGTRLPRHLGLLFLLALAPAFRPTGAEAITVGFWGGRYIPAPRSDYSRPITITREADVIAGMSLTHYPKNRLGYELAAGFSSTPGSMTGSGRTTRHDLDVLAGSLTLLARLTEPDSPLDLFARLGPSWVHHSTPVDIVHGHSDYGLAMGLAIRRGLTRIISVRVDGEDFIYRADYGAGVLVRNDYVFRAGLEFGKR